MKMLKKELPVQLLACLLVTSCATSTDTRHATIERDATGRKEFVIRQVHSLMAHDIASLFQNNSYTVEFHIPIDNEVGITDASKVEAYELKFIEKSCEKKKLTNVNGTYSIDAKILTVSIIASWPWANSPVEPYRFNGTYPIKQILNH